MPMRGNVDDKLSKMFIAGILGLLAAIVGLIGAVVANLSAIGRILGIASATLTATPTVTASAGATLTTAHPSATAVTFGEKPLRARRLVHTPENRAPPL